MLTTPFYVSCAHQTLRDLKEVYEESKHFGPILFLYSSPVELNLSRMPILRLTTLADYDQADWPEIIRRASAEAGASLWGLATEVSMRIHQSAEFSADNLLRTEEWLIYLLSHQGGMLAWGAPIEPGRRLGPIRELTADPRIQKMLAHLSEALPDTAN